jgi:hypothetical protein
MGDGQPISWGSYWVYGIVFVVGAALGYWVYSLTHVQPAGNGIVSTYQSGTGKIIVHVPAAKVAVVGSVLSGPQNKGVSVWDINNPAIPVPMNPPNVGPYHACSMPSPGGWVLQPGDYEIRTYFEYTNPCQNIVPPMPPVSTYNFDPSIFNAQTLITNGTITVPCPTDLYYFTTGHGDQTNITVMIQSN